MSALDAPVLVRIMGGGGGLLVLVGEDWKRASRQCVFSPGDAVFARSKAGGGEPNSLHHCAGRT